MALAQSCSLTPLPAQPGGSFSAGGAAKKMRLSLTAALYLSRRGRPVECPVSSTFKSKRLNSAGIWLRGWAPSSPSPHPYNGGCTQGEHQEYGSPNLSWSSSLQGTGSTPGEAAACPASRGVAQRFCPGRGAIHKIRAPKLSTEKLVLFCFLFF